MVTNRCCSIGYYRKGLNCGFLLTHNYFL